MRKNHGKLVGMMLFMLLYFTSLLAQNPVRGTVIERESGKPVPYVYVLVKGTSTGTMTTEEGTFLITAAPNAVLVFSSIGYVTKEESVGNRSVVNVALSSQNGRLARKIFKEHLPG